MRRSEPIDTETSVWYNIILRELIYHSLKITKKEPKLDRVSLNTSKYPTIELEDTLPSAIVLLLSILN